MNEDTRQERRAVRKDRQRRAMRVHGKRYVTTVLAVIEKKARGK